MQIRYVAMLGVLMMALVSTVRAETLKHGGEILSEDHPIKKGMGGFYGKSESGTAISPNQLLTSSSYRSDIVGTVVHLHPSLRGWLVPALYRSLMDKRIHLSIVEAPHLQLEPLPLAESVELNVGDELIIAGLYGQFRNGKSRVRAVRLTVEEFKPSKKVFTISGKKGQSACTDSIGGPALRENADGSYEIVGIVTALGRRGGMEPPDCQRQAYVTRTDIVLDWINSIKK